MWKIIKITFSEYENWLFCKYIDNIGSQFKLWENSGPNTVLVLAVLPVTDEFEPKYHRLRLDTQPLMSTTKTLHHNCIVLSFYLA